MENKEVKKPKHSIWEFHRNTNSAYVNANLGYYKNLPIMSATPHFPLF